MNNLGNLGGALDLAQGRTQSALQKSVTRLSSGLRVNTAADDPSGLAIATMLDTQSRGLDAGAAAVQDASNALTVADGALTTVGSILQRIRALLVSGRSDLTSAADKANVNMEIDQLMLEINKIADSTSFNGKKLLDGSLASSIPQAAVPVVPANDTLATGAKLLDTTQLAMPQNPNPLNFSITVQSYDASTNLLTIQYGIASPEPSQTYDQQYPVTTQIQAGQNYDNFWNTFPGPLPPGIQVFQINDASMNPLLNFALNNLSPGDVGTSAFVYNTNAKAAQTGSPMSVAVGDHEGDSLSVGIDGVSTAQLGLVDISVSSNDLNTAGSEYRVDAAITQVGSERATIGSQVVALQETATNANTDAVNLTASAANIRDLNVGQETTALVSEQILAQTQTFLRADGDRQASSILALFTSHAGG